MYECSFDSFDFTHTLSPVTLCSDTQSTKRSKSTRAQRFRQRSELKKRSHKLNLARLPPTFLSDWH